MAEQRPRGEVLRTGDPKKRLKIRTYASSDLALVAGTAGNVLPEATVPSIMLRNRVLVDIPRP